MNFASSRFGTGPPCWCAPRERKARTKSHSISGCSLRLVWGEKSILRDVVIGSVTIAILSVLPVLMIMTTLNTVVMYHSINTLTLIVVILLIALASRCLITWSRRRLLVILANRLDTRLNLAIFDRLMTLPIDFFERNQAGELSL